MTDRMTRRQFLVGSIAGTAQAACTLACPSEPKRQSDVGTLGEPELYLPTTKGRSGAIKFADTPHWARNASGWFLPSTISAGCCFLNVPSPLLPQVIRSFRELPRLLEQARSIGTEVVYLVDWYEGGWSNKGDYVPRADLGGEAAFRDGISALHAGGGRLILYVEGFIIAKESNVGKEHGRQWSILQPTVLENPYPGCWKPCPGAAGWLTYIEGVARRIGQYSADGIFLDSCGFQRDWKCVSKAHRHPPASPEVFNQGCVELVRRVRAALRAGNPEAVVLTEGPKLQRLFEYADGSLDWGIHTFVRRWLWDAQGKTDTLTTGWSIDDWHQVLAIGGKLGCGPDVLQPLLQPSASQLLEACLKSIQAGEAKQAVFGPSHRAFFGLHRWHNAGLILGLKMPGLDDLEPRPYEPGLQIPRGGADPLLKAAGAPIRTLDALRPRARAIDEAFAGTRPPPAAAYVRSLLTARRSLAQVIDYGSSVEMVRSPSPHAVGWRFRNARGAVMTAVNVGETTCRVAFPDVAGIWKDGVKGDVFTAQDGTLTVSVPPHSVRLLHAGG